MASAEELLIRPESKSPLFARVNVWPDRAAMQEYFVRTRGKQEARTLRNAGAVATPKRDGDCIGEINFHRNQLDLETIAHEVVHIAIGWAHFVELGRGSFLDAKNGITPEEERYCYVIGRMVQQIGHELSRRKLWEPVDAAMSSTGLE
jgi:hypothetical protein